MENTYNGEGNHELQAKGRQKFRLKTFESFVIEWKEKGRKVYNIVGPSSSDVRAYDVVLNNGEKIKINTEGKWTISLTDLPNKGETPSGESLVEILPEGEMNMYDKLRQEMLQMFQDRAQEHGYETLNEADDLDFYDEDENLIDTPYEYKAMQDEYLAEEAERAFENLEDKENREKEEEKNPDTPKKEEEQEDIAT